ncbi:lysozyme [Amycolatopsis pigmentata]|uniref:Lysozyme n=1 Tax=Amycolatopsis pigmentata TaxID=450801 RepID=A0ABW5FTC1_9PSEU
MSVSIARRSRRRLVAVAAVVAGVVVLGGLTPANASAAGTVGGTTADRQEPEHDHAMGSQIRRVEGTGAPDSIPPRGVFAEATVPGLDVSGYQGNVNWADYYNQGYRFVYTKASEGTYYTNPYFTQQYNGSYDIGMIRGAYHFAIPSDSSGATQAGYFLANGGGWSADGRTLPGALDLEYNPYSGGDCYGLSPSAMTAWIKDFSDTYHARTNKWPAIYTSTSWWNECVNGDFSSTNPLWVARYASSVGVLPYNWGFYTIWQYSSDPIDQDSFNGGYDRLTAFATNHD